MSTESKSDAAVKLLVNALRAQKQCDEDGVMCIVSREAVDEAIKLIERNATPQTQATHGEGEAVAWASLQTVDGHTVVKDIQDVRYNKPWISKGNEIYRHGLFLHPAPSPTAALPEKYEDVLRATNKRLHSEMQQAKVRIQELERAAPMFTEEELLDLRALSTLPLLARSVRQVCAKAAAALSGGGTCHCCEYLVKELREIRDGHLTETQMRVNAAVALNLRPSSGVAAQGDGEAMVNDEMVDRFDEAYKRAYDKAAEKQNASLSDMKIAGIAAGIAALGMADQDGKKA